MWTMLAKSPDSVAGIRTGDRARGARHREGLALGWWRNTQSMTTQRRASG